MDEVLLEIVLKMIAEGKSYAHISERLHREATGVPYFRNATEVSRFLIKHGHRKIKPYKKGKKMNSFTLPRNDAELQEYMEKARARIPDQSPIRKLERIVEKYRFVWHMEMLAKGFAVEKIKEMQKEIES